MTERHQMVVAGLRTGGPIGLLGFFLAWYLVETDQIGKLGAVVVVLLALLSGMILGSLVWYAAHLAGHGIVKLLTEGGGLKPAASFSYQESLAARGLLAEAKLAYEVHLQQHPGDVNALLALARLCRDRLDAIDEAESLLRKARGCRPTPDQELAISNALIDLYHKAGRRNRHLVELARLAERFAGSEVGEQARGALRRLKPEA
jgi:tetratricopeptide (TPR) repeat protein